MKNSWVIGGVSVLAMGALARFQFQRAFTEEPAHRVERQLFDGVEVRNYQASVHAETMVEAADARAAANEGFSRLAGYIFGKNRASARIAMTAPVSTSGEQIAMTTPVARRPERIAMTTPVSQASAGARRWTVAFTMPSGRSLLDLPEPLDARVTLRAIPERRVAVLRFTGLTTPQRIAQAERELRAAVAAAGLETRGDVEVARYDPPWTLPMLRRNEAWLDLA